MKKRVGLLVIIMLMCVGFAAISTTLIINGNTKVSENTQDFDIYFSKARLDTVDVYENVISQDKKTITFETNELRKIGDTSALTYEVTNNSNNYDAEVSLTCTPTSGEYTSITNELDAKDNIVEARNTAKGRVTIKLNKVTTEEVNEKYTCTLSFTALEKTGLGVEKEYKETLLNGTDPVLTENLIPVTIADDGAVKYADVKKEWYSYEDKIWANAVILEDGTNYNVGDTISENDIQSYFVWIPRYRYKLFNVDNYSLITVASAAEVESKAQEIEIEFENKNTAASNGTTKGSWLTHPAFTSFNTNGMWVGKFETGYKDATNTVNAQANESDSTKVIIKPNTYSWRGVTIKNIFETSYNYLRENDSHMMKNTEWGAVAYLSHSKYGTNKEININNNNAYKTGFSSLTTLDQNSYPGTYGDGSNYNQSYNTSIGYLASTTGNISGIYDMSGGAHECIAGYSKHNFGLSGFTTSSFSVYDSKYYDVYNEATNEKSYEYGILGDATKEVGPFYYFNDEDKMLRSHGSWYNDYSNFIDTSSSWFYRGGGYYNSVIGGSFYFGNYSGEVNPAVGFRIVLTP